MQFQGSPRRYSELTLLTTPHAEQRRSVQEYPHGQSHLLPRGRPA
jgi:hypothetical protein